MALSILLPAHLLKSAPEHPLDAWLYVVGKAIEIVSKKREEYSTSEFETAALQSELFEFSSEVANSLELNDEILQAIRVIDGSPAARAMKLRSLHNRLAGERIGARLGQRNNEAKQDEIGAAEVIQISNRGIVSIHNCVLDLRKAVANSTLDEGKQAELIGLLDEFDRLLKSKSPDKMEFLRVFAFVAAGVGGSTTFLAEAPEAMRTLGEIQAIIGEEIKTEEDAKLITAEGAKSVLPPPSEEPDSVD